ncbi:hypothetical protein HanRHA438_Chr00c22g0853211 [Helianthus annuus]|nr:hypothetical protein HanRHA438_Chr00c22g0853211 [Helianthus annuus]
MSSKRRYKNRGGSMLLPGVARDTPQFLRRSVKIFVFSSFYVWDTTEQLLGCTSLM